MRLLTLNVRRSPASKAGDIASYLLSQSADVIVTTEFGATPGCLALSARLEAGGYARFDSAPPAQGGAGFVAVFVRAPAEHHSIDVDPGDRPRVAAIRSRDVVVVGLYFAQKQAKNSLYARLIASSCGLIDDNTILIGDFNTGRRELDHEGTVFTSARQFETLLELGWRDLWRDVRGEHAREYSWVTSKGVGFRIDHALAAPSIRARLFDCRYDHGTRPYLTDHSALIVDLR
jgi:exonuclease III